MGGKQLDINYYLPLFLHYYHLPIKDSLVLPYEHFLALAKGVEVIEARRTHGLVTAINMVLTGDEDQYNQLKNLAFDLDSDFEEDNEYEDEDDVMKRLDDFIDGLTRNFR
jgi:hypothetical protein